MKNIAPKLAQLMKKCSYLQKDKRNTQQGYNYVSAAKVLDYVSDAMSEIGLCSVVDYILLGTSRFKTSKGGEMELANVACKLIIIDTESGDMVTAGGLGSGADTLDKAVAKAQTMALKYAWMSTLNISTGDDPEADEPLNEVQHGDPSTGDPLEDKRALVRKIWTGAGWPIADLDPYIASLKDGQPLIGLSLTELDDMIAYLNDYIERVTQSG